MHQTCIHQYQLSNPNLPTGSLSARVCVCVCVRKIVLGQRKMRQKRNELGTKFDIPSTLATLISRLN